MIDPKPLYIVFCGNGTIYHDVTTSGIFANLFHAEELVERLNEKGSLWCLCRKHTLVTYVPQREDETKECWQICSMCPDKAPIYFERKDVSFRCDCGMPMFGVKFNDPRLKRMVKES